MQLSECASVAVKELLANKTRTVLNVLGVIIGIIALIVMLAVMTGIERRWLMLIRESGGLKKITLESKDPPVGGSSGRPRPLTLEDADYLSRHRDIIRHVSAESYLTSPISRDGQRLEYLTISGGTRHSLAANGQRLAQGRALSDEDVFRRRRVCVIGSAVRDRLFGLRTDPVGRTLEIGDQRFEVVGVTKESRYIQDNKNFLAWKNDILWVPVTFMPHLSSGKPVQRIGFIVAPGADVSRVKEKTLSLMRSRRGGVDAVQAQTKEEEFAASRKSLRSMKVGFSLIAGISLLVGGLGIMNIMLASIAERVREIGIRKALGAQPRDILLQFLIESMIVSGTGGIIGIAGASGAVLLLARFSKGDARPVLTPDMFLLAAIFSVFLGVCFGIYPAVKAAKLDPIEALRYQ
jgi:ABC-type antimicrobial peptide transport system permease subunit